MTMFLDAQGAEFLVNSDAATGQSEPATAGLSNGGFVATWRTNDTSQDASGTAIKARLFDASGAAQGAEFLVNSAAASNQLLPTIAGLANGGFAVAWYTQDSTQDGDGSAIKARLFDASGAAHGAEFLVNSTAASDQINPTIAGLANGGFIVTWQTEDATQDGDGSAIKARLFEATGTAQGAEFLVNNEATSSQYEPTITGLANGGFVVTWYTLDITQDGDGLAIKARLFDASGAAQGPEFLINSETANSQVVPTITGLANGGFVVTWYTSDISQDGGGTAIKARLFDASGGAQGAEFPVNSQAAGNQYEPTITGLSDGGFIVTWHTEDSAQDGSETAIKARVFDASGAAQGPEFLVNSEAAAGQYVPTTAGLSDGGFAVTWRTDDASQDGSETAIKARVFAPVSENAPPVSMDVVRTIAEDAGLYAVTLSASDFATDVDSEFLYFQDASGATGGFTTLAGEASILFYTPDPDFFGTDTIDVTIWDQYDAEATATAKLTVIVTPEPDAPVAVDDTATLTTGQGGLVDVLANDTDADGDDLTVSAVSQGDQGGTVAITNGGADVFYSPAADFSGTETFTYTVTDGTGGTDTATVAVTTEPPPAFSLFLNGGGPAYTPVGGNSYVSDAAFSTGGTPYSQSQPIANTVDDPLFQTERYGTFGYDIPVANGLYLIELDFAEIYHNGAGKRLFDVLVEGNIEIDDLDVFAAAGGKDIAYTAAPIQVNVTDGQLDIDFVTGIDNAKLSAVRITSLADAGDPPVVTDDSYTATEDLPLAVAAALGVLANDTDPESGPLTAELVTDAANGTVVLNADGSFTYTPDADYNGSDSFTYLARDADGNTTQGTATITVDPVNDAPVTKDLVRTIAEDSGFWVLRLWPEDFATDVDSEPLYFLNTTSATGGVINLTGAGSGLFYTPNPDFFGIDIIDVTIWDQVDATALGRAELTIEVTPEPDAPVAVDDTVVSQGSSTVIDVLANDSDVDGDTLSVSGFTQPVSGGTVSQSGNDLVFTPTGGTLAADTSFTYTISDGNGGTDTATVTVEAEPPQFSLFLNGGGPAYTSVGGDNYVPDTPFSVGGTPYSNVQTIANTADDVLYHTERYGDFGYDITVVDGTYLVELQFAEIFHTTAGKRVFDVVIEGITEIDNLDIFDAAGGKGIAYTEQFQVNVTDGQLDIDFLTEIDNAKVSAVRITSLSDAGDPPVTDDDSYAATEDQPLTVAAALGVLANDSDPEGGPLTAELVTDAANGTVALNSDGSFTYTPNTDYNGSDSFTYLARDEDGNATQGTATITVDPVNDAPVAVDVVRTIAEDAGFWALTLSASDFATDIDSELLYFQDASGATGGFTTLAGEASTLFYTPNPDFFGTDTIDVTIWDQNDAEAIATATLTVIVTPEPDAPVAVDDTAVSQGSSTVIDVLANDSDVDGDTLSVLSFTQPAGGTVSTAGSDLVFVPDVVPLATDTSFTYTVSDGNGGTDTATVRVLAEPTVSDVFDYFLVDAVNDVDVIEFFDEDVIDASDFAANARGIHAEYSNGSAGSLVFRLEDGNGSLVKSMTENVAPYAVFGDNGGDFRLSRPPLQDGAYSLTVTAYSGAGGGGAVLATETIDFTLADQITTIIAGREFRVNEATDGNQWQPSLAALPDGGFVAAWTDHGNFTWPYRDGAGWIKARVFDSHGDQVSSEFQASGETLWGDMSLPPSLPSIAAFESGGFVIAWGVEWVYDHSFWLGAQIFDPSGDRLGDEFHIKDVDEEALWAPSLATLDDESFVAVWNDYQHALHDGYLAIAGLILDEQGQALSGELPINEFTEGTQENPSVSALADGGFVVTWNSYDGQQGDESGYGVKARVFDAQGQEVVTEFLVNEYTNSSQWASSVAALADGGFVVTWESYDGQQGDESGGAVKARIFDAQGQEQVSEFLVNEYTEGDQFAPSVAVLADGGFVVSWTSDDGQQGDESGGAVKARIFDAQGQEVVSEFLVNEYTNGNQWGSSVAALPDDGFVVSWTSDDGQQGDESGNAVKARIFTYADQPSEAQDDIFAVFETPSLSGETQADDSLTLLELNFADLNAGNTDDVILV